MDESIPPQESQKKTGDIREEIINESRRKFLKEVGIAGTITASILAMPKTIDLGRKVYGETLGRETVEKELTSLQEQLRIERGVEVDFSEIFPEERSESIEGDSLEYLIEKHAVCEMLLNEFAVYPSFIHKNAGLRTIRVLNSLKYKDEINTAGLATASNGVMHLEYEEKKLEAKNMDEQEMQIIHSLFPILSESLQKIRLSFHHEMEHFIDDVDANTWSKETRGFGYGEEFDLDGVSYLYDDEFDILEKNNALTANDSVEFKKEIKGFVRRYGRKSYIEDRATIAEALYTPAHMKGLEKRLETDTVLAKKITGLKKMYFKKSCGTMDSVYWGLVEKEGPQSDTVAKYLKLRGEVLVQMSDEAFVRYGEQALGKQPTVEEVQKWKEKLIAWIGK